MSAMKKWQHLKIGFGEIERATNNFETCIGKGGYGWVYKGQLNISGKLTMVAVKRFYEQFGQGLKEFLTELDLLFGQQHPNLISLLGYCDDLKEKIIVYEYAERGSLDNYIRPTTANTRTLSWRERLKISVDAASGLDYLHHHVGPHQTIIHRDIKSANILLDENLVAKISDHGLSKLSLSGLDRSVVISHDCGGLDRSVVISHDCGTSGYVEPEYIISGTVTKKSDVYSFGMVLFEVLCGKLCTLKERDGFLLSAKVAKQFYKKKKLVEILDPNLREHFYSESMTKFSAIAYKCLHKDREQRPSMDVVKKELDKTLKIFEQTLMVRKSPRGSWKGISTTINNFVKEQTLMVRKSPRGSWKGISTTINNFVKPFFMFDGSDTDELLWFQDIGKYGGGEYSMAVVQANRILEDQSQIESGPFGTFVGVYDGHGGPEASRYVCDHLFRNFQETSAKDNGVVTQETIKDAFLQTENGFTALVSRSFMTQPSIASVGSCCLVGVIYQQTLFIANLGNSRVVLGKKVGNSGGMEAIQLSSEHNANLEEVRDELKNLHPHDPEIVVLKHGVWRVIGIIQFSRSIGDVYMKHSEYNAEPLYAKFRLPESTVMPILSATPSILSHAIHPSDTFLIFASDGLWEHLTNEEAVGIVHNNPRLGIANRLAKAALQEAAKKRDMRYSDLRKIEAGVRRHFHNDITVIVLFLDYDQISTGSANGPIVSIRNA